MERIYLDDVWVMQDCSTGICYRSKVPGSVVKTLLEHNVMQHPYVRMNEKKWLSKLNGDFCFYREFEVEEKFLNLAHIELVCFGIDTLADIYINGQLIKQVNNMHRTWKIYCLDYLICGKNEIKIYFYSPLIYLENYVPQNEPDIGFKAEGAISGHQHIRKAHSMFGWDWGIQLPDSGIWRKVEIQAYQSAKLGCAFVKQNHEKHYVKLSICVPVIRYDQKDDRKLFVRVEIKEPNGSNIVLEKEASNGNNYFDVFIENPQLWWPNGYGEQPLYTIDYSLKVLQQSKMLEHENKTLRIGLRTLTVSQENDVYGQEFCLMINGVKIFAKGADWIPEDAVYPDITKNKIEYLIHSAVQANFNTIRIWGGGYYPSDDFYDKCDEAGLIVWQDLMFACNTYDVTEEFETNIVQEIQDNLIRIRHHASLGILCGNNEIEWTWADWDKGKKNDILNIQAEYIRMFEHIIPEVLNKIEYDTFFWKSSPSSGGTYDEPNNDSVGDVHYWGVWHGMEPFTEYRKHYFRFCSEFGFQSFPCSKTVNCFTVEQDRNIFSEVMECHQKNGNANSKILNYLSAYFRYPDSFENLLYVTQIQQAVAIKTGVDHWRKNRGRCMGAIYWQLNDNWPVASWSSIDYYGRWKALHYFARHFFAQRAGILTISGMNAELAVLNENRYPWKGMCYLRLRNMCAQIFEEEIYLFEVGALSSKTIATTNYIRWSEQKNNLVVEAVFTDEQENVISVEYDYFVPYKYLQIDKDDICVSIEEKEQLFEITLKTKVMALFVEVYFESFDVVLSDNFMTIPDKKTIAFEKSDVPMQYRSVEAILDNIRIRSLRDTY